MLNKPWMSRSKNVEQTKNGIFLCQQGREPFSSGSPMRRWGGVVLLSLVLGMFSACLQKVPRACQTAEDCKVTAPAIFCYEGRCSEQQCKPGVQETCYEGPKDTVGKGRCKAGYRSCLANGRWTPCLGQKLPRPEFCDKSDNNCDGQIDNVTNESCRCSPQGRKRSCYSGDDETQGKGACKGGVQYCERDNLWGPCLGNVEPQGEICDGFDDDCNGKIDDHPSCTCQNDERRSCYLGDPSIQNVGRCQSGVQVCSNQQWGPCTGMVLPRAEGEDCNTPVDDNCNGAVNEGCGNNACSKGETRCGDACVVLDNNIQHCGGCGNICKGQKRCEQGVCVCPNGQQVCGAGQNCVDLKKDPKHCGSCNQSCANDEVCCGGLCTNTQTSVQHCGGCGQTCSAGEICSSGTCQPSCAANETLCLRACVNVKTDVQHCGACSKACRSGEICNQGSCECTQGFTSCSTGCVDTNNDKTHCGGCNQACPGNQFCQKGACVCPKGLTLCGSQCVDVQTRSDHCGQCSNACGSGKFCSEGGCKDCPLSAVPCGSSCCPTSLQCCNGVCVDVNTHPTFCGSCQNACQSTQVCSRTGGKGTCLCREGVVVTSYTGPSGTLNKGRCRPAIQVCENGALVSKQAEVKPLAEELCNNVDDNCNGSIDETAQLKLEPCPKTLGVCAGTINRKCNGVNGWEPCNTALYEKHNSAYEVRESKCDGLDNDCDGQVDEDQDLGELRPCSSQDGVCKGKFQRCTAGVWLDCGTPLYQPTDRSCDGRDNDCDGQTDEDGSCDCFPSATQTPFSGHGLNHIVDVVFRPTGLLAASMTGEEIRIWRVSDRQTVRVILLPVKSINSRLAWSPDGLWLAVTTRRTSEGIWLFNANTGQLIRKLVYTSNVKPTPPLETQPIAAWSPDSRTLLSGTGQLETPSTALAHPILLWDIATGKVLNTYQGHSKGVLSLAFHPDGTKFVSSGFDNEVKIWNVTSGAVEHKLTGVQDTVWSLDWSVSGQDIAGGVNNGDIVFWRNATGSSWVPTVVDKAHVQAVGRVRFRPNGKLLASTTQGTPLPITATSGFDDRAIRLWDVGTGTLLRTMYGHVRKTVGINWSPDGALLASVGRMDNNVPTSGDVRLWGCPVSCLIQEPASSSGKVKLATLKNNSRCHTQSISGMAYSADGSMLASIGKQGNLCVWSTTNNQLLYSFSFTSLGGFVRPISLTFQAINFISQDLLLLVGGSDNKHYTWSPTFSRGNTFEQSLFSFRLGFHPQRYDWLATASGDNLSIWQVRNLAKLPSSPGANALAHSGGVRALQWSESGALLATGGSDGFLRFWSLELPPQTAFRIRAQQQVSLGSPVQFIHWHPSGELVVAGPLGPSSTQATVRVVANPSQAITPNLSHGSVLTGAAFSPDHKYLVSVSSDMFLKVFDVSKTNNTWSVTYKSNVNLKEKAVNVAWNPNGGSVAVGLEDGSIQIYTCTP
ncbi:MAG: hypothetical protein EP343_22535 [Deltaproteobacteria bacterium]|nr:MAG: hypothetical protein EP343_22535 [Deltaproteobacteria bacterium]